jgi:hypothetical protein
MYREALTFVLWALLIILLNCMVSSTELTMHEEVSIFINKIQDMLRKIFRENVERKERFIYHARHLTYDHSQSIIMHAVQQSSVQLSWGCAELTLISKLTRSQTRLRTLSSSYFFAVSGTKNRHSLASGTCPFPSVYYDCTEMLVSSNVVDIYQRTALEGPVLVFLCSFFCSFSPLYSLTINMRVLCGTGDFSLPFSFST